MKLILTTFISLFISIILLAQDNIIKDTSYFDQDWVKTNYIEDAKFARVVKRKSNKEIVGTVRDYYLPSWKIQFEGKLISENPDYPIGKCTFYYENGNIQMSGTYVDGVMSNDLVQYNENGSKKECIDTLISVFPLKQNKLHSYTNPGSSRVVHKVDLMNFRDLIVLYRINDENSSNLLNIGIGLMAYASNLGALYPLLNMKSNSSPVSTKNLFFITWDKDVAQHFIDTKGGIKDENKILYRSENAMNETFNLKIPSNIRYLFICIQNNNIYTSAVSNFEIAAIAKSCK